MGLKHDFFIFFTDMLTSLKVLGNTYNHYVAEWFINPKSTFNEEISCMETIKHRLF